MKTVACKDFGTKCDFVAEAFTKLGVMKKMSDHVMKVHPDKVAEMKKTMSMGEMIKSITSKIKDK